jgi:hypothetical protein
VRQLQHVLGSGAGSSSRELRAGHRPCCANPQTLAGPYRRRDDANRRHAVSASRSGNRKVPVSTGGRHRNPDGTSRPAYSAIEPTVRCAAAVADRTTGAAFHQGRCAGRKPGYSTATRSLASWRDAMPGATGHISAMIFWHTNTFCVASGTNSSVIHPGLRPYAYPGRIATMKSSFAPGTWVRIMRQPSAGQSVGTDSRAHGHQTMRLPCRPLV